jgi:hypothetical protein
MAADNKYYKRFNFQAVPMEEYEVRDVMRRSGAPDLRVDLYAANGVGQGGAQILTLGAMILNDAPEPAFYAVILFFISLGVEIINAPEMIAWQEMHQEQILGETRRFRVLQRVWSGQVGLPIWYGQPLPVTEKGITLAMPSSEASRVIGWRVTSPKMTPKKGFYRLEFGMLTRIA